MKKRERLIRDLLLAVQTGYVSSLWGTNFLAVPDNFCLKIEKECAWKWMKENCPEKLKAIEDYFVGKQMFEIIKDKEQNDTYWQTMKFIGFLVIFGELLHTLKPNTK